jgi:hypothetical protein
MCQTCQHEHHVTEQTVRYYEDGVAVEDVVESTLMICTEPGCNCTRLDPTDYEDRIELIKSGEIDA